MLDGEWAAFKNARIVIAATGFGAWEMADVSVEGRFGRAWVAAVGAIPGAVDTVFRNQGEALCAAATCPEGERARLEDLLNSAPVIAIDFAPVFETAGEKGAEGARFCAKKVRVKVGEPNLLGVEVGRCRAGERDKLLAVAGKFGIVRHVDGHDPFGERDCGVCGVVELDFTQGGAVAVGGRDLEACESSDDGRGEPMESKAT